MPAKMERTRHPGIYKRGSRYVITWTHRGKQHKASYRTLEEARKEKGLRASGDTRPPNRDRFDDYAEKWLRTYRGRNAGQISDSTRRLYRRAINRFAIPYFGSKWLSDIEPPDVRGFITWMEEQGVRPPSVRVHMSGISALFATAYEDGHIKANPTTGVRLRQLDNAEHRSKTMTHEELSAVLTALPPEWQPLFTFLAQTGLRISELLGLTWADLDLSATRPVVKVRRQRVKGQWTRLKTRASSRDVPLGRGMVRTLLILRARSYGGEHAAVFGGLRGGFLKDTAVRGALNPVVAGLGLGWVTPHTFRHTCASLLFAQGKNPKQVQVWLGHADVAFTMRTYVHLMDDGLGDVGFLDGVAASPRVRV